MTCYAYAFGNIRTKIGPHFLAGVVFKLTMACLIEQLSQGDD